MIEISLLGSLFMVVCGKYMYFFTKLLYVARFAVFIRLCGTVHFSLTSHERLYLVKFEKCIRKELIPHSLLHNIYLYNLKSTITTT